MVKGILGGVMQRVLWVGIALGRVRGVRAPWGMGVSRRGGGVGWGVTATTTIKL